MVRNPGVIGLRYFYFTFFEVNYSLVLSMSQYTHQYNTAKLPRRLYVICFEYFKCCQITLNCLLIILRWNKSSSTKINWKDSPHYPTNVNSKKNCHLNFSRSKKRSHQKSGSSPKWRGNQSQKSKISQFKM